MLGGDGLASHPGGSSNVSSRLIMLWKLDLNANTVKPPETSRLLKVVICIFQTNVKAFKDPGCFKQIESPTFNE